MNLVMRGNSPIYTEGYKEDVPELLLKWTECVLEKISIVLEDHAISASGDSRSDVKHLTDVLMPLLREWYVSHLMNRAFSDAFGATPDRNKSKNLEARTLIDRCCRTIEMVHKSELLSVCF